MCGYRQESSKDIVDNDVNDSQILRAPLKIAVWLRSAAISYYGFKTIKYVLNLLLVSFRSFFLFFIVLQNFARTRFKTNF